MPELEDRLRELSGRLDVPPAPDVVPAVLRRIDQPLRRRFPLLRYAIVGLVVLAVGFAGLVAASPEVRAALSDLLRFAGIVVQQTSEPPTSNTEPSGQERVSDVAEASRRIGMRVRVPAELGGPDEVYVIDDRVAGLVYRHENVRVEQFDGSLDLVFLKTVPEPPRWVRLDGTHALWFDRPHELRYIDEAGNRHREPARLAGNTLIWQRGAVTFRLEGDLDRPTALAIARSLD